MKLSNPLIAAGLIVISAVGLALAQPYFPNVFLTSPTGSEIVDVAGIGPGHESVYLTQFRDAAGYTKSTPATGFTASFASGKSLLDIVNPATDATGTINLAAKPVDGQQNCFYTKNIVTTLTLQVPAGSTATLNDAVTATAALTRYCYLYSASNTTWDRSQ